MIGKTISHYNILEKLGQGGMGVVYKAEDTKLKRTVALKFLTKERTRKQVSRERFEREAQAAAALNHPNIVTIYEINEHEGQTYIAMEYVEGQNLQEKMSGVGTQNAVHPGIGANGDSPSNEKKIMTETAMPRGMPLQINEIIDITTQICEGLHKAHEAGIIHRDIKPQNILIDNDGRVKILDFGLAKLKGASPLTKESTTLGTCHYMSPEQTQGAQVDHRADIWSLGVVLYEMITGQLPFKGEYALAVVYCIMNEEPEPVTALRTDIPVELERIVKKTLAKAPSERYQHVDDLLVDLKKKKKDTKPEATPSLRSTPIYPAKKTYRTFLIPGIFLLIALTAFAYFLFFKGPPKPVSSKAALDPKRVVVAVFENLTGDKSLEVLGRIAADWLTQGISRLEIVEAVPNMVLMELLPAKSGKEGPQSMVYLQSLAKDVDARTVVTGSYYLSGENLCFQANITDMAQEKLLFSLEPIIGPKKSPIKVIDKLKQKVMVTLINHFDPGYIAPLLGDKTPTYTAYKELMAGLELWDIDYSRAITHFKRAMELDPDFYVPKLIIAVAYSNLSDWARADNILRQLYEKRDQLSDFERCLLEWIRAYMEGNREEALRMLRKAGDIGKKSQAIRAQIGADLLCLNRPRETIAVYEQFDENYWRFFFHNSLRINVHASAYHMMGNFQKELELARKWQKLFPEYLYLLRFEARALAALGKTDEVKKVIDKSLITPSSLGNPGDVMWEAALELRAHGHMKVYREIVTRAVDWYKNRPPGEAAAEKHRYELAETLYLAEQWDEAEKIFKVLAGEKHDNIEYKGYLGVLAARKGNLKEARKISDELKKMSRPYLFGQHTYWCARIASLLNEKQRAVELLRESFAQGLEYGVDFPRQIDFEPIKDYLPFKELMRPKG